MKKNGFESPLEVQQVFTWIIFIAITAEFYALIFPIMEDVTAIVVGVVYGVLSFLSALFSFMACKIDPIDPRLEGQLNGIPIPREHGGRTAYCYICKCDVYQGSKHCHFCGKCVRRFDHHCRWLNNCIGCKNYKYFIALLLSTFSVLALQFGLSVWLIILYHTQNEADDDSLNNKVEESFDSLSSQGYIIIIYLFGIVIFPIVSLLMQLLGFHALLATRGLTTYQYIVQQQKRDHERRTIKASTAAQVTDEHIRSSPMCDSSSRANKDDITAPASNFATRPRSSMVNLSMQTESLASAHYLSHRKATSDLDNYDEPIEFQLYDSARI